MSLSRLNRWRPGATNIWPGFVDALSSLLLVIIFLLSMFALAQFFLSQALSGRDEALIKLRSQVLELGDLLALEREANADLRSNIRQLSASLQSANLTREELQARVEDLEAQVSAAQARVGATGKDVDEIVRDLRSRYAESQQELTSERERTRAARSEVERLNAQLATLRAQLASLQEALEASEAKDKEQQAVIVNLGKRLNAALASKVEELARYRSEFFGRLREVLGNRDDIRIVGDRFIFQSEIFFGSGTASVGPEGRRELTKLANTLLDVAETIPDDVNWLLQVEGHTDPIPISTPQFPSNWELSTARALSVVHFLQAAGIPPERLAAAGYGPFHPIVEGRDREANRRNRRIEIKLTQR